MGRLITGFLREFRYGEWGIMSSQRLRVSSTLGCCLLVVAVLIGCSGANDGMIGSTEGGEWQHSVNNFYQSWNAFKTKTAEAQWLYAQADAAEARGDLGAAESAKNAAQLAEQGARELFRQAHDDMVNAQNELQAKLDEERRLKETDLPTAQNENQQAHNHYDPMIQNAQRLQNQYSADLANADVLITELQARLSCLENALATDRVDTTTVNQCLALSAAASARLDCLQNLQPGQRNDPNAVHGCFQ